MPLAGIIKKSNEGEQEQYYKRFMSHELLEYTRDSKDEVGEANCRVIWNFVQGNKLPVYDVRSWRKTVEEDFPEDGFDHPVLEVYAIISDPLRGGYRILINTDLVHSSSEESAYCELNRMIVSLDNCNILDDEVYALLQDEHRQAKWEESYKEDMIEGVLECAKDLLVEHWDDEEAYPEATKFYETYGSWPSAILEASFSLRLRVAKKLIRQCARDLR